MRKAWTLAAILIAAGGCGKGVADALKASDPVSTAQAAPASQAGSLTADVTVLTNTVKEMQAQIAALQAQVAAAGARFVGASDVRTKGRIQSGALASFAAAANICASQFGAKAHMCSAEELRRSTVDLQRDGKDVPEGWVDHSMYAPGLNKDKITNSVGIDHIGDGLTDTCQGYTYNTHDIGWSGNSAAFAGNDLDGTKAWRYNLRPCFSELPVLCCR